MKFHVISRSMIRRWLYSQYCLFKHDWILHWNVWRLLKNNNTLNIWLYILDVWDFWHSYISVLKTYHSMFIFNAFIRILHFTDRRITWQLQPFSFRKQMAEISQNLKDLTLLSPNMHIKKDIICIWIKR